ncbi:MAG: sulfate reduction electron transfer complex DsrMKJOP subunit DsrO [Pseudomonadota bacterium]
MTAETKAPEDFLHPTREDAVASRRVFLKGAAAAAVTVLAPGVTLTMLGAEEAVARPLDQAVTGKTRWGMLIDVAKCSDGCTACVTACSKENGWSTASLTPTDAQWIRKVSVKNPKDGSGFAAPVMCQHCAHPPCVDVCPTGASFKRADGIVLVDKHICIGCRYCMMACPYGARSFVHEPLIDQKDFAPRGKGTVESCTMCVHRVDAGGKPACAEACADSGGGAMLFGDLNDPASEIAKRVATYRTTRLRADLGCEPGIYYRNI